MGELKKNLYFFKGIPLFWPLSGQYMRGLVFGLLENRKVVDRFHYDTGISENLVFPGKIEKIFMFFQRHTPFLASQRTVYERTCFFGLLEN